MGLTLETFATFYNNSLWILFISYIQGAASFLAYTDCVCCRLSTDPRMCVSLNALRGHSKKKEVDGVI